MSSSHFPLRFDLEVPANGRLEVPVPMPASSHVTVFVVDAGREEADDLMSATTSSTEFWDNPYDDEDWNDA